MTILKCKMCGGRLELINNSSICECEYCGLQQALPNSDDDKIIELYNRANHFRQKCDFDKAEDIYEKIVNITPDDPEVHWSLLLCRYGIEYVEDPITFESIPTCHRTIYDSIFKDPDYIAALEKADHFAVDLYKREAFRIDKIQKNILEISNKEKPFDVFICYKETDSAGKRTLDSVKSQEIYDALSNKGYKVFFSRITLEDKLGQLYEPYIFSALNTAKVMILVGTNPDYFNAVWVRNEWGRYLKIMAKNDDRILIPCYLGMTAYELPDELLRLQAQDMSKIGFLHDLTEVVRNRIPKTSSSLNVNNTETTIDDQRVRDLIHSLLQKIEEKEWLTADDYCNQIIYIDPKSTIGYLYKIYVGYQNDWDMVETGKKLNQLFNEITDDEKQIINSHNYESFFLAFLSVRCVTRCKYLLNKYPTILNKNYAKDCKFLSILSYAVIHKNYPMAKSLLELGVNPNQSYRIIENQYGKTEYSSLADAIWNTNNIAMTELLLSYHADPNRIEVCTKDDGHKQISSMLNYAVYDAQNVEIVRLLLKYGANPNQAYRIDTKNYGNAKFCPLSDAIIVAEDLEIMKVLLEYGADPNRVEEFMDDEGSKFVMSMLSYSLLFEENLDMAALLVQYGATWDHIITIGSITKIERRFPYKFTFSKENLRFLKSLGWKGSLF